MLAQETSQRGSCIEQPTMQPKNEDGCTLAAGAAATLAAPRPEFLVASAVDTKAPTRRTSSTAPRMATTLAAAAIGESFDATRSNEREREVVGKVA